MKKLKPYKTANDLIFNLSYHILNRATKEIETKSISIQDDLIKNIDFSIVEKTFPSIEFRIIKTQSKFRIVLGNIGYFFHSIFGFIKYHVKRLNNKRFWISIKRKDDCLFSRRNGYKGKIIFNYSIRLRLFNYDII